MFQQVRRFHNMHTYSLQVQHAREKLERLPRKQPTPAQTSKETPKAATPAVVDDSDRYLLTRYDHMMSVVYTSTYCAPFSGRKTESLIQF